jgi:HSP20 family protein
MTLVRWLGNEDLFRNMERWQRDMERRLFSNRSNMADDNRVFPPINIYDDGENYIARAEIPGVKPEDIDVTVTGQTLTLRGQREILPIDDDSCYHRRERRAGEFRRALDLPEQVDSSKVHAKYTHGVLEILLPRAEQAKLRKISVNAS